MRRWLAWVAVPVLLTAVLSGCAREAKRENPDSAPGPGPGEIQTIRVLTYPGHPVDHYLDLLIPPFQEAHPRYRVEKVHVTGQVEIRAKVEARAADVVPVSDWSDENRDLVQDLTAYIRRDRLDLGKYGSGFADLRTDGGTFFLPMVITPLVVLAHTEYLEAAGATLPQSGWTWDEFRAMAKQLTQTEPRVFGLADSPTDWLGQLWLEGKLGERHWNLTEKDLREVLGYVQTLAHTDNSLQPPKPAAGQVYFNAGDFPAFLEGKAAMMLGAYVPDQYERMGVTVSIAPMPHHPGGRRVSRAFPWAWGMAATTDRPDAAWALIHFATGPKGAEALARAGILPMYQDEAVRAAWQQNGNPWPEVTATFFDTTWDLFFFSMPDKNADRHTHAYRMELERALHESIHRVATGELDVVGAVALYTTHKAEQQRRFPLAQR